MLCSVVSNSGDPKDCSLPGSSVHGLLQARILHWVAISFSRVSSWPRDQTHVSCVSCTGRWIGFFTATPPEKPTQFILLLLSHFSRVRLCATPSLGFSRQEDWSGLPFPSPMHKSEKWKWSRSVVSDSSWPHGLQPTRLLRPWDFPSKSTGVGCHCLLQQFILLTLKPIFQLYHRKICSVIFK